MPHSKSVVSQSLSVAQDLPPVLQQGGTFHLDHRSELARTVMRSTSLLLHREINVGLGMGLGGGYREHRHLPRISFAMLYGLNLVKSALGEHTARALIPCCVSILLPRARICSLVASIPFLASTGARSTRAERTNIISSVLPLLEHFIYPTSVSYHLGRLLDELGLEHVIGNLRSESASLHQSFPSSRMILCSIPSQIVTKWILC